MNKRLLSGLLICGVLLPASTAMAQPRGFSFGVIDHPFRTTTGESTLRDAIAETDAENLAFVVSNGIKASSEPCTDKLYSDRKTLLNSAKNGLIVSLAASDWVGCTTADGKSAAIGRLNRLRELFFVDEFSLGATRIPLVRQSATAQYRGYGENVRWEFGKIMFATINLPETNNHYLTAAGRNGEFEDRLIANRYWLNRIFTYAELEKAEGIVLFSDGNPLAKASPAGKRDGFAEVRKQIGTLATGFPGRVLIVHGSPDPRRNAPGEIRWRGSVGVLEVSAPWTKLKVDPSTPTLFTVAPDPEKAGKAKKVES